MPSPPDNGTAPHPVISEWQTALNDGIGIITSHHPQDPLLSGYMHDLRRYFSECQKFTFIQPARDQQQISIENPGKYFRTAPCSYRIEPDDEEQEPKANFNIGIYSKKKEKTKEDKTKKDKTKDSSRILGPLLYPSSYYTLTRIDVVLPHGCTKPTQIRIDDKVDVMAHFLQCRQLPHGLEKQQMAEMVAQQIRYDFGITNCLKELVDVTEKFVVEYINAGGTNVLCCTSDQSPSITNGNLQTSPNNNGNNCNSNANSTNANNNSSSNDNTNNSNNTNSSTNSNNINNSNYDNNINNNNNDNCVNNFNTTSMSTIDIPMTITTTITTANVPSATVAVSVSNGPTLSASVSTSSQSVSIPMNSNRQPVFRSTESRSDLQAAIEETIKSAALRLYLNMPARTNTGQSSSSSSSTQTRSGNQNYQTLPNRQGRYPTRANPSSVVDNRFKENEYDIIAAQRLNEYERPLVGVFSKYDDPQKSIMLDLLESCKQVALGVPGISEESLVILVREQGYRTEVVMSASRELERIRPHFEGAVVRLSNGYRIVSLLYILICICVSVTCWAKNWGRRNNGLEKFFDFITLLTVMTIGLFGMLRLQSEDTNSLYNWACGRTVFRSILHIKRWYHKPSCQTVFRSIVNVRKWRQKPFWNLKNKVDFDTALVATSQELSWLDPNQASYLEVKPTGMISYFQGISSEAIRELGIFVGSKLYLNFHTGKTYATQLKVDYSNEPPMYRICKGHHIKNVYDLKQVLNEQDPDKSIVGDREYHVKGPYLGE